MNMSRCCFDFMHGMTIDYIISRCMEIIVYELRARELFGIRNQLKKSQNSKFKCFVDDCISLCLSFIDTQLIRNGCKSRRLGGEDVTIQMERMCPIWS